MTQAANLVALARRGITGVGNLLSFDANGRYPAGDGSQLTNMKSLGAGQSLQDVTSSRTAGVWYQNVTGKDILLTIWTQAGTNSGITIYANAVSGTQTIRGSTTVGSGIFGTVTVIIKQAEFYCLAGSMDKWLEYRL